MPAYTSHLLLTASNSYKTNQESNICNHANVFSQCDGFIHICFLGKFQNLCSKHSGSKDFSGIADITDYHEPNVFVASNGNFSNSGILAENDLFVIK